MCAEASNEPSLTNAYSAVAEPEDPPPPDVSDSPCHVPTGRPPSKQLKRQAVTSPSTPSMNTRYRKIPEANEPYFFGLLNVLQCSKLFAISPQ